MYAIARILGSGGFACVREGKHTASQTDACVKVVEMDRAGRSYTAQMVDGGIYNMCLEMSKRPHVNVVRYLDIFESRTRRGVAQPSMSSARIAGTKAGGM